MAKAFVHDGKVVPKRQRVRLAKSEVLLIAAVQVQAWANRAANNDPHTIPFEQWPPDDDFVELVRRYGLDGKDLSRICTQLAEELENRALRAGYEEAWVDG